MGRRAMTCGTTCNDVWHEFKLPVTGVTGAARVTARALIATIIASFIKVFILRLFIMHPSGFSAAGTAP